LVLPYSLQGKVLLIGAVVKLLTPSRVARLIGEFLTTWLLLTKVQAIKKGLLPALINMTSQIRSFNPPIFYQLTATNSVGKFHDDTQAAISYAHSKMPYHTHYIMIYVHSAVSIIVKLLYLTSKRQIGILIHSFGRHFAQPRPER
jgi:hypothetical protein